MFTSNRNGFRPPQGLHLALPAAVRDGRRRQQRREDRPPEHRQRPAPGRSSSDGRVMFSSLRVAGAARRPSCWGIWSIHPDGTNWDPVVSACSSSPTPSTSRRSSPTAASSSRSTTTRTTAASAPSCKLPRRPPRGQPAFGPAYTQRSAQRAAAQRPLQQRQGAVLPAAVQPRRHRGADAVRPQRRRPGRPVGARQERFAARRQGHAPVRRAGQPPADRLVARPGQPSLRHEARRTRSSTAAST